VTSKLASEFYCARCGYPLSVIGERCIVPCGRCAKPPDQEEPAPTDPKERAEWLGRSVCCSALPDGRPYLVAGRTNVAAWAKDEGLLTVLDRLEDSLVVFADLERRFSGAFLRAAIRKLAEEADAEDATQLGRSIRVDAATTGEDEVPTRVLSVTVTNSRIYFWADPVAVTVEYSVARFGVFLARRGVLDEALRLNFEAAALVTLKGWGTDRKPGDSAATPQTEGEGR